MSPAREAAREQAREQARVLRRLPYQAAAIFIAVLLWVVVRGEQVIERTMLLTVAPTLEPGLRLDGARPAVRVRVSGRARELLKLGPTAPLRADASNAGPGPVRLDLRPSTVELPDGVDATIRDVHPRLVTVRVAKADDAAPAGK